MKTPNGSRRLTNASLTLLPNSGPPGGGLHHSTPACNWPPKITTLRTNNALLYFRALPHPHLHPSSPSLVGSQEPQEPCLTTRPVSAHIAFQVRILVHLWTFVRLCLRIMRSAAYRQQDLVPANLTKLMVLVARQSISTLIWERHHMATSHFCI